MQYKFLSKFLQIAGKNQYLWTPSSDGVLPLFSVWICEQDGDSRCYGITKNESGKIVFCYGDEKGHLDYKTAIPLKLKDFAERLKQYNITEVELKKHFLEEVEPMLREHELQSATINEKVNKKLKKLEQLLLS